MKRSSDQAASINDSLIPSSSSSSSANPARRLFDFDFIQKKRTSAGSINDSSMLNESSLLDSVVLREDLADDDDEIDRDPHEMDIEEQFPTG